MWIIRRTSAHCRLPEPTPCNCRNWASARRSLLLRPMFIKSYFATPCASFTTNAPLWPSPTRMPKGITRVACHPEATNAGYNYIAADGHFNFGTKTTRNAGGCWFDAGDTHSDVPNTATACWFLLETARDFGSNVPPYSLNLPESTNVASSTVDSDGRSALSAAADLLGSALKAVE